MIQWQAGGLDTLTLDSLYDEGAYRASQQAVYGAPAPNPFEAGDPFAIMSNSVHMPPAAVQTQNNPFAPFQSVYPQTQQQQNPFGDSGFEAFPAHPQTTNPFGL